MLYFFIEDGSGRTVMNRTIAIASDTNCGVMPDEAKRAGIYLVPMPIIIDGVTYYEGESITREEFFREMNNGASIYTSQPSPASITELWDSLLRKFDQVIYIPMSSGLSGSCSTSKALAAEDPYAGKVFVADNHRISATLWQSLLEAKYLAQQGKDCREIVNYLEKDSTNSIIYIMVNSLERLTKTGRITEAGARLATVLRIKPILKIEGDKLDAFRRSRGIRHAMNDMIAAVRRDLVNRFSQQTNLIFAAYSGTAEFGRHWMEELMQAFPGFRIVIYPLPLSICCHIGTEGLGVGITKNLMAGSVS